MSCVRTAAPGLRSCCPSGSLPGPGLALHSRGTRGPGGGCVTDTWRGDSISRGTSVLPVLSTPTLTSPSFFPSFFPPFLSSFLLPPAAGESNIYRKPPIYKRHGTVCLLHAGLCSAGGAGQGASAGLGLAESHLGTGREMGADVKVKCWGAGLRWADAPACPPGSRAQGSAQVKGSFEPNPCCEERGRRLSALQGTGIAVGGGARPWRGGRGDEGGRCLLMPGARAASGKG